MMTALLGSVTDLEDQHKGANVAVGSHGGSLTGRHALRFGVASLICHDAGVGLGDAGIAGLSLLDVAQVPAAAVGYQSARIGDPEDMLARGIVSYVNAPARRLGIVPGVPAAIAAQCFVSADPAPATAPYAAEGTFAREIRETRGAPVFLLDSASSISPEDDGTIVVTGSHGGLPGNRTERALRARPLFVVFNDAGIGIDQAGIRRLSVLEKQGVAAACVSAKSAAIGNARSSFEDGVISSVNSQAAAFGALVGMRLRPFIDALALRVQGAGQTKSTRQTTSGSET